MSKLIVLYLRECYFDIYDYVMPAPAFAGVNSSGHPEDSLVIDSRFRGNDSEELSDEDRIGRDGRR